MIDWNWERFSVFPDKYDTKFLTIGPGGDRVSFSAQQRRATILASLFAQEFSKKDRSKPEIAVIGGGLAGVTLFGILHSIGFQKTTLFESDPDELLMLQTDAQHRLAHPSYNTWPRFADFESTTRHLPMFRWGAGSVDDVVEQIRRQFSMFLSKCPEAESRVCMGHKLDDVIDIRGETKVTGLQLKFQSGRTSNFRADFAIAAMGFGPELSVTNTERYWQMDHLEVVKKNIRKGEHNKFVIAGNGDGALIDAARTTFLHETHDIGIFKALHLTSIFGLRSATHKTPAKSIKTATRLVAGVQKKSKAENAIIKIEDKLDENPHEAGSLEALESYLTDTSFQSGAEMIRSKICPKCAAALRIVGNRDSLLAPGTAAINKFVAAQVVKQGCQTVRGHLMVLSPDDGSITAPHIGAKGSYTIKDNETNITKHDDELNDPNTKVLCRIGAKPRVVEVCRGADTEAFKKHFAKIGNLQELDATPDPSVLTAIELVATEIGKPSIYSIEPYARNHLLKWFGENYSLIVVPAKKGVDEHFRVEYPHDENPENAAMQLGGFDHHLFGVPTYFKQKAKHGDQFSVRPARKRRAA